MSASEPRLSRSRSRRRLYLIGAWVGAPILAALALLGQGSGPLTITLAVCALVLAVGLSTAWFLSLDEVAQRAHYEAWFWGGNFGLFCLPVLVLVLAWLGQGSGDLIAATLRGLDLAPELKNAFVVGFFTAIIPMSLGYAVWWAVFWLRNR